MFDKSLERRGECSKSGEIISLDAQRRNHIAQLENLLTKRKVLSKEVGNFSNYEDTAANKIRKDIKNMKKEIAQLEATLKDIENDLENLLLTIPNLLSDDVPFGTGESDNVEVSRWGEIKSFPFKPKEHFEVEATKNDINFEAAGKTKICSSCWAHVKKLPPQRSYMILKTIIVIMISIKPKIDCAIGAREKIILRIRRNLPPILMKVP